MRAVFRGGQRRVRRDCHLARLPGDSRGGAFRRGVAAGPSGRPSLGADGATGGSDGSAADRRHHPDRAGDHFDRGADRGRVVDCDPRTACTGVIHRRHGSAVRAATH